VTLDARRVTQIWAPGEPRGQPGSGYRLDGKHVLTAAHVVADAAGGMCDVRGLRAESWQRARVVWRSERADAALLEIESADPASDEPVGLGRRATNELLDCRAVGFPDAQRRPVDGKRVRDVEDAAGRIAGVTSEKSGRFAIDVAGTVPLGGRGKPSPWGGMSGAPVLCGGLLVGVVTVHAVNYGTARLEAVPVTTLLHDDEFRAAVGERRKADELPAVEHAGISAKVLDPQLEPLPVDRTGLHDGPAKYLLEPRFGVAPFHGRDDFLDELTSWLAGEDRLKVRLVTGTGGSGKTRLAAELCRRRTMAGAVAGFLAPGAASERLAEVQGELLVVVDEAAARVPETRELLRKLDRARNGPTARVLLLARERGEWWPKTVLDGLDDAPTARLAIEREPASDPLGPPEGGAEARAELFAASAEAFALRLDRSVPARRPDLSDPAFERVLFVQLAALEAVEASAADGSRPRDLLAFALERERRYWGTYTNADLPPSVDVRAQAVAVATLTTADSGAEAVAALAALPELPEDQRWPTARWLRDLYPRGSSATVGSGGWFVPLEPDLLGEALVAEVLDKRNLPDLPAELLRRAPADAQVRRTLAVLARASRGQEEAVFTALKRALAAHLDTIWPLAIDVAKEGGPLGFALAAALRDADDAELAARIYAALPGRTVELGEVAVEALDQALAAAEAASDAPDDDPRVAELLHELATRRARLGETDAALAAAERAVTIRDRLAAEDPETYLPRLAASLNSYSARLASEGRPEEALVAARRSEAIRAELARSDPEQFEADWAVSLNNLAIRLADNGHHDEALEAVRDAVEIRKRLARDGSPLRRHELAASLSNLSGRLARAGEIDEGFAAAEKAVEIRRELAAAHADEYEIELPRGLNALALRLRDKELLEEALEPIAEAVAIRRRLAGARPDAFMHELSRSLQNQAVRLGEAGHAEEAVDAAREAVEIRRRLYADRPAVNRRDLANSLITLARRLWEAGGRDAAIERRAEAIELLRELHGEQPSRYEKRLANAEARQADWLEAVAGE
jgi:hypothetical protein